MGVSTKFRTAVVLASMFFANIDGQAVAAPEIVLVRSGALTLRGLLWRPTGQGPSPAVLFSHGSGRSSDPNTPGILGPAFARHGYAFLYLFRRGAGLSADQGTNSGTLMARALAHGGQGARNKLQLKLQEIELSDVRAGLAVLRQTFNIDRSRLALAGHSFGGQLSLLANECDTSVRGVVVFGAAAASWEKSPELRKRLFSAVRNANAPVFFIHAANDFSIAPGTELAAEMKRLGKLHRVKIYPSVGQTPGEGLGFVYLRPSEWEPDVFTFLDDVMRP